MNGCHGNQSCHVIFIKTSYMFSEQCFKYSYEKLAFWLKGSMYPKFYVIFPKFTPPSQGVFMIRPNDFSVFIYVGCPICFLQNISIIGLMVLEKKAFECVLIYMGMTAIFYFGSKDFSYFSFLQFLQATYEIWLHLAQWIQRRSRLNV